MPLITIKKPEQSRQTSPANEKERVSSDVVDINRSLKIIEERYTNLRRKLQITEQNMIELNKRISSELKTLSSEISDVKKEVNNVMMTLREISDELKKCAKKDELRLIDRYISFWEPVNFIRREEAEKIINELMNKNK